MSICSSGTVPIVRRRRRSQTCFMFTVPINMYPLIINMHLLTCRKSIAIHFGTFQEEEGKDRISVFKSTLASLYSDVVVREENCQFVKVQREALQCKTLQRRPCRKPYS